MKILFLSFYYKPDLSACSFRAVPLVNELIRQLPPDSEIDVLTTRPQRYQTFNVSAPQVETCDIVTVRRLTIPTHKSGMIDQSKAFAIYAKQVLQFVRSKRYDLVFATSSRLMTATLGALVSRLKRIPLYLDIRDVFVETIQDVLSHSASLPLNPILSLVERFTINSAGKVNLVSPGFRDYFSTRYPEKEFTYYTNGIDDEFVGIPIDSASPATLPLTVLYAGNLGECQGLHYIIPDLAKKLAGRIKFLIVGDGGRKQALIDALQKTGTSNVEIRPPVNRDELITTYQKADILFIHLSDSDAFKRVLPSKLFEYGAMGKPIWAGLAGYSAEFVRNEIDNSAIFYPCNMNEAIAVFDQLEIRNHIRSSFVKKYARKNIMPNMAKEIIIYTEKMQHRKIRSKLN